MQCMRCGLIISEFHALGRLGPQCAQVALAEAKAFCKSEFNQTVEEFFDGCDQDFAGDHGQTLEEYQAEHGASHTKDWYVIETMEMHGLWPLETRGDRHWAS